MKVLEKDSIPHIRALLLLGPHYFFVVLAQQIRSVLLVLPSVIFFFFSVFAPGMVSCRWVECTVFLALGNPSTFNCISNV